VSQGTPMSAIPMTPSERYDRTAVLIHWILGAALLAQLAFGWILGQLQRGSPARAVAINMHKSTGLMLALLILLRIFWRWRHAPPAYPAHITTKQVRIVKAGHMLLYICMIGMPLSGYLASNFSRHGINFLNRVPLAPWGPDDKAMYGILNGTHDVLGMVFSGLVIGHIALALYHALIARDGLFSRMR
jgi:cytochrome b561